jgi:hypothetical protein
MHFSCKKAYSIPTVGFSFLPTYDIIVPVVRREMKNLAQKLTKETKLKNPFVAFVTFCKKL